MGLTIWFLMVAASFAVAVAVGQDCDKYVCTTDFNPVCGSDGNLYPNVCQLQAANCRCSYCMFQELDCSRDCATKNSWSTCALIEGGVCRKSTCGAYKSSGNCAKSCGSTYSPVCGSDRRTYGNDCQFEIARCLSGNVLRLVSRGACDNRVSASGTKNTASLSVKNCARSCAMVYSPVCASDGNTYSNECVLAVAACQSGSDIVRISNTRCATTTPPAVTSNAVPIPASLNCMKSCPLDTRFVCASDGKTYFNQCFFEIAVCSAQGDLIKSADGLCPALPIQQETTTIHTLPTAGTINECDIMCSMHYAPVCGSDGNTYGNTCLMQLESCQRGQKITEIRKGECEEQQVSIAMIGESPEPNNGTDSSEAENQGNDCERECKALYEPVCGSDGHTYPNRCAFELTKCVLTDELTMIEGACPTVVVPMPTNEVIVPEPTNREIDCTKKCSRERVPVCGSDGQTYINECNLDLYACRKNLGLKKVGDGHCSDMKNGTQSTAETKKSCEEDCSDDVKAVCGSDKVTYANACTMRVAACKQNITIEQVSDRPCGAEDIDGSKPVLPYARCRVPAQCAQLFNGTESDWTCVEPMICRPAQCTLDDSWQVVTCGASECSTTSASLDQLGYCKPVGV